MKVECRVVLVQFNYADADQVFDIARLLQIGLIDRADFLDLPDEAHLSTGLFKTDITQ